MKLQITEINNTHTPPETYGGVCVWCKKCPKKIIKSGDFFTLGFKRWISTKMAEKNMQYVQMLCFELIITSPEYKIFYAK